MTPTTPLVLVRALHFWSVSVLFGGTGFLLALGRGPAASMLLLRTSAVVAAVTGAGWFVLVFAEMAGGFESLGNPEAWTAFADAPFGPPWLIRLALCGLALAAAAQRRALPFLPIGAALVIDQAWLGHAAVDLAAKGSSFDLVFYWLHVGAGMAWVGSLVMLCWVLFAEGRLSHDALALFAWVGVPVIAALVGTGLVEAGLRGVTPQTLVTTPYGRIVAAKSLVFAAMLALALSHRVRIRRSTGAMRITVSLEASLGLAVLALAATLGVTPPG